MEDNRRNDRFYIKFLLSLEGIGPQKIFIIKNKFSDLDSLLNAHRNELLEIPGINASTADKILSAENKLKEFRGVFEREENFLTRKHSRIITFWDEDYPRLLKQIYFPPILLYVKGDLTEADGAGIAVVGTRNPSAYGKKWADKIAGEIAANGITVVSGMARGIDSISHRAALRNGGRTIAVIGSGLDVIYPPENRKLFGKIIENGAVISEYPPGTKPDAQNFPRRNRIISGLTLGAVIVESKINGGAMQTAAYALDQNREVFAVPGNLGNELSEGANLLIQKGEAKLLLRFDDIADELRLNLADAENKKPAEKPSLSLFEEKIFSCIEKESKQIDLIAAQTGLSTPDCLVHLLSMELKGIVRQLPGKVFSIE